MAKQVTTGERQWYVIQTNSGYENAVVRNLRQRIDSMGMGDKIFDVVVPTEKKIKVKRGKRIEEVERIYPGYVLVNMVVDDESWYIVRNTPRVTGFVGSGTHPLPMSEMEVQELFSRMNSDTTQHDVDFDTGDSVRIIDGPFKDLEGQIDEVDRERGKVRVLVSMFGRETPVELDFFQVQTI